MTEHTDELRSVDSDDDVILTIDDRTTLEVSCTKYKQANARDPDIIRERHTWFFETDDGTPMVAGITDGLREREEMEPFPLHNQLFDQKNEETFGYITGVEHQ